VPYRLSKPSDFFQVLLLFVHITLLLTAYEFADKNRSYIYIVLLGYVLISIFCFGIPIRIPFFVPGPTLVRILNYY
jgi:hypothetical protein